MHDRAADPIGAATSAAAVATEIMILLSTEVRITQVRLSVEEKRSELLQTYSCVFPDYGWEPLLLLRAFFSLAISSSHLQ
jgi:hypothetical protein